MSAWQTVGGLTADHFPLVPKEWTGPENGEAILDGDDNLKAIRGTFQRPDGSRRIAECRYLKASTKHRFYSPSESPQ